MELNAIKIGRRIKEVRTNANISQEKFAETIQSSTQTISNIETGKVIPNIQTLANIADYYECSLNFIIGIKG